MYVYCTGVCTYSTYILHKSICPLVVEPYTIQVEAGTPLTPKKYRVIHKSLLSAVSVLVVAQSNSEIPEGLMNNPVLF